MNMEHKKMQYMIRVAQGVRVFVNDINPSGNKVIVFLHGWPASYELFEYQYNKLPQLGYRCIGIDTRGFGNSYKPWNGYEYNSLADDILAVIKELRLNNVTLLGHSTAGAVAVRYMTRHRGYGVSKLVLCAAAAPALVKSPRLPQGQNAAVINNIIEGAYKDRPAMLRSFGNIFFYTNVSSPLSNWLFNMGLKAASWATIAISKDWLVEELYDDLPLIQVPTLIMHGVHDQVVPFALGELQHKGIKNSKLVPFQNSGHGLFYDEMEKFNHELVQFTSVLAHPCLN